GTIRHTMKNETWGTVRQELLKSVGHNNYKNWIEPLEFAQLDDGVALFHVPSLFIGDWVQRNFGEQIMRQIDKTGASVNRIEFRVPAKVQGRPAAVSRPVAPARAAVVEADLPGATLDDRFTFDSFVVGKPNELAHAAARRV